MSTGREPTRTSPFCSHERLCFSQARRRGRGSRRARARRGSPSAPVRPRPSGRARSMRFRSSRMPRMSLLNLLLLSCARTSRPPAAQLPHLLHRCRQVGLIPEDADLFHHELLHLLPHDMACGSPGAVGETGRSPPAPARPHPPARGPRSAFLTKSAMCLPALLPKTTRSTRLLVPSRLAPCTETQAHSPAAYRPS